MEVYVLFTVRTSFTFRKTELKRLFQRMLLVIGALGPRDVSYKFKNKVVMMPNLSSLVAQVVNAMTTKLVLWQPSL